MKAFHHHLLTHLVWLSYHQGSLCAMRILNASIVRSVPECWALCRWIMHGWAVSNLCDRQKYFRLGQKIFWDKKIFGWVSAVLGCVTGVAAPVAGGWMESCVNLCSNQITGSRGFEPRPPTSHLHVPGSCFYILSDLGGRGNRGRMTPNTLMSRWQRWPGWNNWTQCKCVFSRWDVGGFFRFGIQYLHILLSKQTRQLSPLEKDVEEAPLDSV